MSSKTMAETNSGYNETTHHKRKERQPSTDDYLPSSGEPLDEFIRDVLVEVNAPDATKSPLYKTGDGPATKKQRRLEPKGISKLPAEVCLEIIAHCAWPEVRAMSYVNSHWNTITARRIFHSIWLPAQSILRAHGPRSISKTQRLKIRRNTAEIRVYLGSTSNTQREVIEAIRLVDVGKCTRITLLGDVAIDYSGYLSLMAMARSMPKLIEIDIPKTHATDVAVRESMDKIANMDARLTMIVDPGQFWPSREVTVGLTNQGTAGTLVEAVHTLAGSKPIRLTKLELFNKEIIFTRDLLNFGNRLGFSSSLRTDFLVNIKLTQLEILYNRYVGRPGDLNFINVHNVKVLELHMCSNVLVFLKYIAEQGYQHKLELQHLIITSNWSTREVKIHEEQILNIWENAPKLDRFEFESVINLEKRTPRVFERTFARYGPSLRFLKYVIPTFECGIRRRDYSFILRNCIRLEEFEIYGSVRMASSYLDEDLDLGIVIERAELLRTNYRHLTKYGPSTLLSIRLRCDIEVPARWHKYIMWHLQSKHGIGHKITSYDFTQGIRDLRWPGDINRSDYVAWDCDRLAGFGGGYVSVKRICTASSSEVEDRVLDEISIVQP